MKNDKPNKDSLSSIEVNSNQPEKIKLKGISFIAKKVFFYLWIVVIGICLCSYFVYPSFFTAENLSLFFKSFNNYMLLVYILFCIMRGFTLIPNTPFVIAGALLFPNSPYLVLFISLSCILFSAFILYSFSEFLGFDTYFNKKYPDKIARIKAKLDSPNGLFLIVMWAFFPLAPTDLVCYAAGTIRMNIFRLLLGVFLGELPICSFYIFTLQQISISS